MLLESSLFWGHIKTAQKITLLWLWSQIYKFFKSIIWKINIHATDLGQRIIDTTTGFHSYPFTYFLYFLLNFYYLIYLGFCLPFFILIYPFLCSSLFIHFILLFTNPLSRFIVHWLISFYATISLTTCPRVEIREKSLTGHKFTNLLKSV